MNTFTITPKVNETQEFIEIANDFSNPLDLVREAISNSYDANARNIRINFDVQREYGESTLKIELCDDGDGMNRTELQNFFDLGNSSRREDLTKIGEKGHGTKVYLNSRRIHVFTSKDGKTGFHAFMDNPYKVLFNRQIPIVEVEEKSDIPKGTTIVVLGYNNDRRDRFTHSILKDYIIWFTKHGTIEKQFSDTLSDVKLELKGLDKSDYEYIQQGHYFPENSLSINKLFDKHTVKAPDYYSKKIIRSGSLKNHPEIRYNAIFSIEGKYIKYEYNEMLRRTGHPLIEGAYTVQDRYGLWICKDFIPIQRKNEWISIKGSEYTKLHAFFNCQDLRLTANRGSIDNTPTEILHDVREAAKSIYDSIAHGDEWSDMEWLESEASSYQTTEKEEREFHRRIKRINRANIAEHRGTTLVEPERESGVLSIFLMISLLEPDLFPFRIIDYDTHDGIDVIAKADKTTLLTDSRLYYVEFKRLLENTFNHSFKHLHSIVCWDTALKHGDTVLDINDEERTMDIVPPDKQDDYTHFFLDNPRKSQKIEVYCLKHYLRERLNIDFRPRTRESIA